MSGPTGGTDRLATLTSAEADVRTERVQHDAALALRLLLARVHDNDLRAALQ